MVAIVRQTTPTWTRCDTPQLLSPRKGCCHLDATRGPLRQQGDGGTVTEEEQTQLEAALAEIQVLAERMDILNTQNLTCRHCGGDALAPPLVRAVS